MRRRRINLGLPHPTLQPTPTESVNRLYLSRRQEIADSWIKPSFAKVNRHADPDFGDSAALGSIATGYDVVNQYELGIGQGAWPALPS